MTMLGAQLDELSTLSTRLQTTATDVGTVKDQAITLTSTVVGNIVEAAKTALSEINTQMDLMSQTVAASTTHASATQWTGANADRFRQGATEFQTAMGQASTMTNEAFQSFVQTASTMTESLESYVTQLSGSLTSAQESAAQMSGAVEGQRANLDQVMNLGIALS